MVDLKYHIYSLAAVFLALAIGILIGIGIVGGPAGQSDAIDKQRAAIETLRNQFKAHSKDLATKQAALTTVTSDLKMLDSTLQSYAPQMVAGQLAGRSVSIVEIGSSDHLKPVQDILTAAGAVINSSVRVDPEYGFDDPKKMADAAKVVPLNYQQPGKEPYQQVWAFVGNALASGTVPDAIQPLQQTGIIQAKGDLTKPNRMLVLLCPKPDVSKGLLEILGRPLYQQLVDRDIVVVLAAGSASLEFGQNNEWITLGSPHVSHINLVCGRISLVEALSKAEGAYGLGPEQDLIPQRLLPKT